MGGNGGNWRETGVNGGLLEDRLLIHREAADGLVQPHLVASLATQPGDN